MKAFLTILITLLLAINSLANVWTVDDDGHAQFIKIQDAIDAASDGDTVFVYPGTYYENLFLGINKIWLIGSGRDSTSILPADLQMNLLTCHIECYIYNFTIDGNNMSKYGISIISKAILRNNIIKNCKIAGIDVPFGTVHPNSNILIESNEIINNNTGIRFNVDYPGHPDSIKIINNNIYSNDYGILYFPEQIISGPPFDTLWHVNADSNYWGFNNKDSIDEHIWDKNDSPKAIAKINYNYWFIDSVDSNTYNISTGIHFNNIYNNNLYNIIAFNDIGTGIKDELPGEGINFRLYQNYPNPFNNQTTIEFNIKRISKINLSIYDLAGQRVEKLIENEEYSTGNYSISWKNESLSSNIYFALLTDGFKREVKKLILLK